MQVISRAAPRTAKRVRCAEFDPRTGFIIGTSLLVLGIVAWSISASTANAGPSLSRPHIFAFVQNHRQDSPDPFREGPSLLHVQARSVFDIADISSKPDRAIPLKIELPLFSASDYLLLSFRNLPEGFSLTSGFRANDAWLVSAHESIDLKLLPPMAFTGEFDMEVQLLRGRKETPESRTVRVSIGRRSPVSTHLFPSQEAVNSIQPAPSLPQESRSDETAMPLASPQLNRKPLDPVKVKRMLARARSLLEHNDIAAARLIYTRLARQGSAQGALLLAQTYDPAFLSQYAINGLEPDLKKARQWYEYAASLGDSVDRQRQEAINEGTVR